MIFGLFTFTIIKLHPSFFIIRSAIHQAMTHLILMGKVGKLKSNMWLWGADQLVLWVYYNEQPVQQPFFFYNLTHDHFRRMTWSILALDLIFIDPCRIQKWCCPLTQHWTMEEFPPPKKKHQIEKYKESLVPKPRSTPSSTPISRISNSLVMIYNCQSTQASNNGIHQLDDSTKLEVSTLASTTTTTTS